MRNTLFIIIAGLFFFSCQKVNNPVTTNCDYLGTVVDYTGLDGCGFLIELDNGSKLEPLFTGSTPSLYDGMRVGVSYSPADTMASICMVGQMAWITCFQNMDCYPVEIDTNWAMDFPRDPVKVKSVKLEDDLLKVKISYGGGCENHVFKLMVEHPWCGTPPVPPSQLILSHDANNDLCEALIIETLCFDLSMLQVPDTNSVDFQFIATEDNGTYQHIITYNY